MNLGFPSLVEPLAESSRGRLLTSVAGRVLAKPWTALRAGPGRDAASFAFASTDVDSGDYELVCTADGRREVTSTMPCLTRGEALSLKLRDGFAIESVSTLAGDSFGIKKSTPAVAVVSAPASGTYCVIGLSPSGKRLKFLVPVEVDAPCVASAPSLLVGGRPTRTSAMMLLSERLEVAPLTWTYAPGTVAVNDNTSGRAVPLPCDGRTLGAGVHEITITAAAPGCITVATTLSITVGRAAVAPELHTVHALEMGDGPRKETRREAGASGAVHVSRHGRLEVFIGDDAPGVSIAAFNAAGVALPLATKLKGGWADVSAPFASPGEYRGVRFVACAPGVEPTAAGPYDIIVGAQLPVPALTIAPAFPDVYVRSGGTLELTTRGLETGGVLLVNVSGGTVVGVPDDSGRVRLAVVPELSGRAVVLARRLGFEPSEPLECTIHVDAPMPRPVVTIKGEDTDRVVASGARTSLALSCEPISIALAAAMPGAVVSVKVDDRAASAFPALPATYSAPAGAKLVMFTAEAPGMVPSEAVVISIDVVITAEPVLALHPSGVMCVGAKDKLCFQAPSSGLPGASLLVVSSARPAPIQLGAAAAGGCFVAVSALGSGAAFETFTLLVREVAPGAIAGPPLRLSVAAASDEYNLPTAALDAASGMAGGPPITLLGHACIKLTSAPAPPDAILRAELRDASGRVLSDDAPAAGCTELWCELPPGGVDAAGTVCARDGLQAIRRVNDPRPGRRGTRARPD